MNRSIKIKPFIYMIAAVTVAISSCKKDNSVDTGDSSTSSTSSTITVASNSTSASTDSIYIIQPCGRGEVRDSIAASALPANITTYLTANYSGYTFRKAYSIKAGDGAVKAYVAIVYYNDKPVGVLFDSNGNFLRVLEQREKGDLTGKGWHPGGRFEDRGGIKKDSVAISSLPAVIASYFTSNYPTDTLIKAFINRDSSYLVISKDNGLSASLFTVTGKFVKRVELPSKPERYQIRDITSLLAAITSYLDTAYPSYTFKKAYSLSLNGAVKAYIVIIDANNTRYALEFDATGKFVHVKTLF